MLGSIWSTIRQAVSPPIFEDDERKTSTARILNGVVWLNVTIWALTLFALPYTEYPLLGILIIGALVLFGAGILWVLRLGYVYEVAQAFVFLLWIITTILVAVSGGIDTPETAGFIIVIMAAGMLAGVGSAFVYTGLCAISAIGIYLAVIYNLVPTLTPMQPFISLVVVLINIFVIVGILYLALSSRDKALIKATENERKATISLQELQRLTTSLEDQVLERTTHAEEARIALEIQLEKISQQTRITDLLRGEQAIFSLATKIIKGLCLTLELPIGAIFLRESNRFNLAGSYAFSHRKDENPSFCMGEGLIGQSALEQQTLVLTEVPDDFMAIHVGLFDAVPRQIAVVPFLFNDQVLGVIELGNIESFSERQLDFLEQIKNPIGIAFGTALARKRVDELLEQTQIQANELRLREEELSSINLELQIQSENLRNSQKKLQSQQADLEIANSELEEKTQELQQQRAVLDQQNTELRVVQQELEAQTEELLVTNRYKSEFLANMSHELRTPLNSLLILAHMLAEDDAENLTEDQQKSAQIIYQSGSDLLDLINDILDLSKVEAGRMTFSFAPTTIADLIEALQIQFKPVSENKNVALKVSIEPDIPQVISTDSKRLQQVIKNLLSNAFKFTESGSVKIHVARPMASLDLEKFDLSSENAIAVHVQDTGIGIPPDKQGQIFEAFQQADGSTNREYGGTGLGLAIVRELTIHLGGFVTLDSTPGEGSTFTIILPENPETAPAEGRYTSEIIRPPHEGISGQAPDIAHPIETDRSQSAPPVLHPPQITEEESILDPPLKPGERLLLVIEDDQKFADILDGFATKKGFRCLSTSSGETGLALVRKFNPSAIILDLNLPGISGWEVLEMLKNDPEHRHIPVHIISAENESIEAFQKGVIGFLTKPVNSDNLNQAFAEIEAFIERQIKSLLLIEDDVNTRHSIIKLLSGADVEIVEAGLGETALDFLRNIHFDCIILDLALPDMSGFDLLEKLHAEKDIARAPIIIYTGRELTENENNQLLQYADSIIVKGVKSPERLLDETALFLHQIVGNLPSDQREAIQKLYSHDEVFQGKKVLIADDDMRNAFALSRLLGERGLAVEMAPNGQRALDILDENQDIDLILMDIMMPVLDGLEATRRIRQMPEHKNLPIFALTAKAMKGDREQCLAAGANDYLSKPIDPERLFSMLRVWLYD